MSPAATPRRRAVVLVLDGLMRRDVAPETMPQITALRRRGTWFDAHRGVFPSVTRVSAASLATGCRPAGHGLAGNTMALTENGRLAVHDVGPPEFVATKRRLTGRVLDRPTLAERLAGVGGAIAVANASPGAAYMLDPDGHGHVWHRAGSYGPGRVPLVGPAGLEVGGDGAGDAAATERFLAEFTRLRPALGVLWLCEPDKTQHASGLSGEAHRAALAAADWRVARVAAAVAALRAAGEEVLFVLASDHGHETVAEIVDVEAELIAAGLKAGAGSDDVVVAPNGTAALVYVAPEAAPLREAIGRFLDARPWAVRVVGEPEFAAVGLPLGGGLAFAVSLSEAPGVDGAPPISRAVKPLDGKPDRRGTGQHGGFGSGEQSPVLLCDGSGFAADGLVDHPTSLVDIAPTVLAHFGLPHDGTEGRPLQILPTSRNS